MKKAVVLSAICLMILCAACAKKEEPAKEPETAATEEAKVGVPNPMVEVTKDELMEKLGLGFNVPEGAENVKYFIIDGKMAEMQFVFNTVKINARILPTAEYEDISGMYYQWQNSEKGKVGYSDADIKLYKGETESAQIILWYDAAPGLMYSVSATGEDLDGFDIEAIAQQTYVQTQGDVG